MDDVAHLCAGRSTVAEVVVSCDIGVPEMTASVSFACHLEAFQQGARVAFAPRMPGKARALDEMCWPGNYVPWPNGDSGSKIDSDRCSVVAWQQTERERAVVVMQGQCLQITVQSFENDALCTPLAALFCWSYLQARWNVRALPVRIWTECCLMNPWSQNPTGHGCSHALPV